MTSVLPAIDRRAPRSVVGRAVRSLGVSVTTTLLSLSVLALLVGVVGAPVGPANVLATVAGIGPSFVLNRRWAWGRTGKGDLAREALPFWIMSLTGLVLSTLAVEQASSVARSAGLGRLTSTIVVLIANLATFATLWLAQFALLDRVLFRHPDVPAISKVGRSDLSGTGASMRSVSNEPIHHGLVEVVVPVYNEEKVLEQSIRELTAYLDANLPTRWRVVIANNASTDGTWAVAERLAATIPGVQAFHLSRKGRGRALSAVWSASDADVVSYMDVDLSTNLASFLPLVAPLLSGHSQVSIGNRLMKGSRTTRQWKRELLSRGYNMIIRLGFRPQFSDAQCGFKAVRADVAHQLLPHVQDATWFFDTELLLLADRAGHRIYQVPVDWIEDLDTRVHIPSTVGDDLKGLWRMRRAFWRGQPVVDSVTTPSASRVGA